MHYHETFVGFVTTLIEYKFGTNIVFQTEIFHRGLTTDTICLISHGRLLHFFPVRVNIPENSGKSIAVKIVVPIVVAAILIIVAVVLYCRCVIRNLIVGCQTLN